MTPQIKGIKDLHELKEFLQNDSQKEYSIVSLFKQFCSKQTDELFQRFKTKGISFNEAILKLILMTVGQMTIFRGINLEGDSSVAGKDAFYGLKNNPLTDWRMIVMAMVIRFETLKKHAVVNVENMIRCLIADDTAMQKRGKTMEGISRIWDHVFHRSILGFKGLVLSFWDGVSFIPIDFSLHNERGKNPSKPFGLSKKVARGRYNKKRPDNAPGSVRLKELEKSKITSLIEMLGRTLQQGIKAEYLLVDSWFMCEELIRFIFEKPGMFILGMCKMGKAKYDLGNKSYDAKQLLRRCKRTMKVKRSRKIGAHYYILDAGYKGMQVRLFFSQYPNQTTWNLLLTDNSVLTFDEAIRIYQIRWGIEVFFKEAKQYLRLGKCQSNDFDAQIADISIIMIAYMMLGLKKRFQAYDTIGGVFRDIQHELIEATLAEKLFGLFCELLSNILSRFNIDPDEFIKVMLEDVKLNESIIELLAGNIWNKNIGNAA
jgi:hypothetical protein